jgi:hypothetical protein
MILQPGIMAGFFCVQNHLIPASDRFRRQNPLLMNRDGAKQSIWQTEPDFTPSNNWNKAETYDVLVVGAGITGLTTALLLQEKGQRVIIAEGHNVGWGTSGGTTSHINTVLDNPYSNIEKDFGEDAARLVHACCREAIDLVAGLCSRYNIDADFSYRPGYLFSETPEEESVVEDFKESSERVGVVVNWTDHIPVPVPFTKAIRYELQAQIHASRYLLGLARAFESLGGVILQSCPVGEVAGSTPLEAETTLGTILANKIVWATHIPPGINLLHFRNAPYRSYVMAVRLSDESQYPDALVYDAKDPYHYYRTQEINGQKYLVAGGNDHKTGHEPNTDQVFRELEAYLRKYFSISSVDFSWSSQYYEPADGLPYIGLLPGHSHQYCATGFSGNGITLGSFSSSLLCDIILECPQPYQELFSPSRIKPIAGFMEFIKENADVVKEFIGKRFAYDSIKELAEIAPGEGRVVSYDGKKLAVYKDDSGLIHAVSPVCTHAKCIVGWNGAERTWDCPCHGARYAPNGTVITGPARHALELVQWKSLEGD